MFLARGIESRVAEALDSAPIVILEGARAVGKTSLVRHGVEQGWLAEHRTFEDPAELAAAKAGPRDYVAQLPDRTAIDEIQLFEELLVAIKAEVDAAPRPGRFLLTGSTRMRRNALGGSDPLVGRVGEALVLSPLTLGERVNSPRQVLGHLLEGEPGDLPLGTLGRSDLVRLIKQNGLPRSFGQQQAGPVSGTAYVSGVTALASFSGRDVSKVRKLTEFLAARTATPVNIKAFHDRTGISRITADNYLGLLEEALLIRRLPSWSDSLDKSALAKDKLHFFDTGIATDIAHLRPAESAQDLGRLAETFVVNELAAQAQWLAEPPRLYHWRPKGKDEVDLLVEDSSGQVTAFEVKAAEGVEGSDFGGIDAFAERYPKRFRRGIVFYTGERVLPFGEKRWAVPLSAFVPQSTATDDDPLAAVIQQIQSRKQDRLDDWDDGRRDRVIHELTQQFGRIEALLAEVTNTNRSRIKRETVGSAVIESRLPGAGRAGMRSTLISIRWDLDDGWLEGTVADSTQRVAIDLHQPGESVASLFGALADPIAELMASLSR